MERPEEETEEVEEAEEEAEEAEEEVGGQRAEDVAAPAVVPWSKKRRILESCLHSACLLRGDRRDWQIQQPSLYLTLRALLV